jgi:hypothetical protein
MLVLVLVMLVLPSVVSSCVILVFVWLCCFCVFVLCAYVCYVGVSVGVV